ncbi:hypothetical protein [Acinetobacter soli]|uniref:hypothetical protein n=1 Tax=Acinetobacter soli TaxID=487316 RepID=UPI00124FF0F8|nr:hypothetical protein [Acinetobacter soli]
MADKPISLQKLVNADKDADTIEQVTSADKNTTVVSRLGRQYPSLAKALQTIIDAGGFKPYSTEAELKASVPVIVPSAAYAFDTKKVWLWNGSAWLDEGTSALDVAIQNIKVFVDHRDYGSIFVVEDAVGNIVAALRADGSLLLTGLSGSVQQEFSNVQQQFTNISNSILDVLNQLANFGAKIQTNDDERYIFNIIDANENIVFALTKDGELLAPSINADDSAKVTALESRLNDLALSLSIHKTSTKWLTPNTLSFNPSDVLALKCNIPLNIKKTVIDTPYRLDDGVVHPNVIELVIPVRGYKYLMCIDPYLNGEIEYENPVIYGSNDLISFKMLNDMPQPLDAPAYWENPVGYLSDSWFTYDHVNHELYCCYRKAITVGPDKYNPTDIMSLWYRKTNNLLVWSEPVQMFPDTLLGQDNLLSPCIVWDDIAQLWCMFYFSTTNNYKLRTNPDFRNINGWSAPINLGFGAFVSANGVSGSHHEVKWVGDYLFSFFSRASTATNNGYFAYAHKSNLKSWTYSTNEIMVNMPKNTMYKGSFLPVLTTDNKLKFKIFWTYNTADRAFFVHETNAISL